MKSRPEAAASCAGGTTRPTSAHRVELTLHVSLVLATFQVAQRWRKPPEGVLHYSDRGVKYACQEYAAALSVTGLVCSMSRRGNRYDNAAMESFWSTLKNEPGLTKPSRSAVVRPNSSTSITSRPSTTRRDAAARQPTSCLWPTKTNIRKTTAKPPDSAVHAFEASILSSVFRNQRALFRC